MSFAEDEKEAKRVRTASEMDRRLIVVEVQMLNLARKLDDHIATSNQLVARLDERMDRSDITQARLIGGLIVAQFLAILFAPALRAAFGLNP